MGRKPGICLEKGLGKPGKVREYGFVNLVDTMFTNRHVCKFLSRFPCGQAVLSSCVLMFPQCLFYQPRMNVVTATCVASTHPGQLTFPSVNFAQLCKPE